MPVRLSVNKGGSIQSSICVWLCAERYRYPQGCFLPLPPSPQRRIPIDELSSVCPGIFTRCVDQVTNKIPHSPAQKRARHQVSLPYSSDTTTGVLAQLTSPSFPSRPGPSIPIYSSSENSLTPENYARRLTDKELTNQVNQHRRTHLRNIL